jgi:hypothetical protein
MITRADPAPARRGRIVRLSLALSLVVHVLVLLAAFGTYDALERLRPHAVRPPKHDDETVTISTAIRFEKRPQAALSHPSRAAAPAIAERPVPPEPNVAPPASVAAAPRPLVVKKQSTPPPPARQRELAKSDPHAVPQSQAKPAQTAAPRLRESERQVALAQHEPLTNPEQHRAPGALSAAQIAQIQNDLAASIASDRAQANPLSNVTRPVTPSSTIRRFINIAGRHTTMRGAQGLCAPLQTWTDSGYIYFYVTCRTQRADGTVRNEAIPWPLRFRPSQVAYGPSGPAPPPGEIPLPLPGWKLPPPGTVDPDVIDFLRERHAPAVLEVDAHR